MARMQLARPSGAADDTVSNSPVPPFPDALVEQLAAVLGDTGTIHRGRDARLLREARVPDPGEMTESVRISTALLNHQRARPAPATPSSPSSRRPCSQSDGPVTTPVSNAFSVT